MPHPVTPSPSFDVPTALSTPQPTLRRRFRAPFAAALTAFAACALAVGCDGGGGEAAPPQASCVQLPSASGGGQVCGGVDTVTVGTAAAYPRVYRGIPYAKAPVGAAGRRWKPPVDTALTGTVAATRFGKVCPQGKAPIDAATMSESCLFLNVWAPASATTSAPVPVMVFIHGGAFVMGAGSSPLYRGAYMAALDTVVVVTLNYRLGALGFLYDADAGIAGNLGLLDQQKAMQWVRRNIGAFGGDSAKVTVFGESAGAMSVGFHLFTMPSSDSLFRAAIMESNPIGVPYRDTKQAQTDGDRFAMTVCRTARKLPVACNLDGRKWFADSAQKVSLDSVMMAQSTFDATTHAAERLLAGGLVQGLPWTPVVDGTLVTGQPVYGYAANMRAKPFVFGMNRDEGVPFADAGAKDLTPTLYQTILGRTFGDAASDSIRSYKAPDGTRPYAADGHASDFGMNPTASAFSRVLTDFIFKCANLFTANKTLPKQGSQPVYGYHFQRTPLPVQLYDGDTIPACKAWSNAVCHGNELPYVFSSLGYASRLFGDTATVSAADVTVSNQMVYLWGWFGKYLAMPTETSANAPVVWTAYTGGSPSLYTFGTAPPQMWNGLSAAANCPRPWSNVYPLGTLKPKAVASADWGRIPAAAPPGEPSPAAARR